MDTRSDGPQPAKDSPEESDLEIIARIESGDADAFEDLYWRYRDWTLRLARRLTGSDADALDVLQETFAYLHGKFPGFELRSALTTLLYRVVTHLSIRSNQRRRRHAPAVEPEFHLEQGRPPRPDHGTEASPTSSIEAMDERRELARAIETLSPAHRQVVLLRFVEGLSVEEVSEALAIAAGTVKSRLHHALAHLRENPDLRRYFQSDG